MSFAEANTILQTAQVEVTNLCASMCLLLLLWEARGGSITYVWIFPEARRGSIKYFGSYPEARGGGIKYVGTDAPCLLALPRACERSADMTASGNTDRHHRHAMLAHVYLNLAVRVFLLG